MGERRAGPISAWWARYRRWILVLAGTYILIMVFLIFVATGPQKLPFLYQVF
jgi:hypothetical protein